MNCSNISIYLFKCIIIFLCRMCVTRIQRSPGGFHGNYITLYVIAADLAKNVVVVVVLLK